MPRLNLTAAEAELITAVRAERNIYNSALADAIKALKALVTPPPENVFEAILALRKE